MMLFAGNVVVLLITLTAVGDLTLVLQMLLLYFYACYDVVNIL